MQPISEVNEQVESAAKEKTLKDAATNTNARIADYGASVANVIPTANTSFFPTRDATDPTSLFSCPNFQGDYLLQHPALAPQSSMDLYLQNEPNTRPNNGGITAEYLHPSLSPGDICYQRSLLRRSPVAYNIRILNNEGFGRNKINPVPTTCRSPSNIVYMPAQRSFNSEREFHNACYGGIRTNLDSRLSSSDGSLASSISRSENRYVTPHPRVVDLLDLQTVFCDPVVQHQKKEESKNTVGNHLSR